MKNNIAKTGKSIDVIVTMHITKYFFTRLTTSYGLGTSPKQMRGYIRFVHYVIIQFAKIQPSIIQRTRKNVLTDSRHVDICKCSTRKTIYFYYYNCEHSQDMATC